MLILIPVDSSDVTRARVTLVPSVSQWALVDFDEGMVRSVTFHTERPVSGERWIDFIILADKFENYMPYMEEGMMVLCVREEKTIEEIMEAFKFKELDEVGL